MINCRAECGQTVEVRSSDWLGLSLELGARSAGLEISHRIGSVEREGLNPIVPRRVEIYLDFAGTQRYGTFAPFERGLLTDIRHATDLNLVWEKLPRILRYTDPNLRKIDL